MAAAVRALYDLRTHEPDRLPPARSAAPVPAQHTSVPQRYRRIATTSSASLSMYLRSSHRHVPVADVPVHASAPAAKEPGGGSGW